MIQILGIRTYVERETGEVKKKTSFFSHKWRAKSVPDLYANIDKYLSVIPENERYNLHYTLAVCEEKKGRKFVTQNIIPIDIDYVEYSDIEAVKNAVIDELKLDYSKTGINFSGHGLHFIIQLPNTIDKSTYFASTLVYYKAMCGRINQRLFNDGLSGSADSSIWTYGKMLRLPNTENRKEGKEPVQAKLLQSNIEPQPVSIQTLADLPVVKEQEAWAIKALQKHGKPDTEAVQEGCGFLKHCKDHQDQVTEPQWYAMMSIIGRLENGRNLVHEYSKGYSRYDEKNTDLKLEHSLEAAGPRTCENINTLWEGCHNCPHFKEISSPIQIANPDHISSEINGFWIKEFNKKTGETKRSDLEYDDLVKAYRRDKGEFFTDKSSYIIWTYDGSKWCKTEPLELEHYVEQTVKPSPKSRHCIEFYKKMQRTRLKDADFFNVPRKLNFQNGVLDLATMEFLEHSKEFGFTYALPYSYEEDEVECPVFDRFMEQVTLGDTQLQTLILEYIGYLISGVSPALVHKCAMLYGTGGNGKSVLLELIRNLIGEVNCSSVSIKNMNDPNAVYSMVGKLANITDETPKNSFLESSTFKSLVTGDSVQVRKLYVDYATWKCTTRLIFSCNDLPATKDHSDGLFRRLIIIPFNATFSHEKGNLDPYILKKLLKEKSAIIKKVTNEFKKLEKRDYNFTKCDLVEQEKEAYRYDSDSILQFVNDMVDKSDEEGQTVPSHILYKCYTAYCNEMELNPSSSQNFSRRIMRVMQSKVSNVEAVRQRVAGSRARLYRNIKVKAHLSDF